MEGLFNKKKDKSLAPCSSTSLCVKGENKCVPLSYVRASVEITVLWASRQSSLSWFSPHPSVHTHCTLRDPLVNFWNTGALQLPTLNPLFFCTLHTLPWWSSPFPSTWVFSLHEFYLWTVSPEHITKQTHWPTSQNTFATQQSESYSSRMPVEAPGTFLPSRRKLTVHLWGDSRDYCHRSRLERWKQKDSRTSPPILACLFGLNNNCRFS